jgi:hypothetical protein
MHKDYRLDQETTGEGPTGAILRDLPSPYLPHSCGLLHLPRFIAKIRKHLSGDLPPSYQRNFCRGFDRFLCLHLGWDPEDVVAWVRGHPSPEELDVVLIAHLPKDPKVHQWNRKMVQMGMSEMGREKLASIKADMGVSHREDLLGFADMIDYDEGRID